MDAYLRNLEKEGEIGAWSRHLIRLSSGMTWQEIEKAYGIPVENICPSFSEPFGPISGLDARCAYDGCDAKLSISDCPYCSFHHVYRDEENTRYLLSIWREVGVFLHKEDGHPGPRITRATIQICQCHPKPITRRDREESRRVYAEMHGEHLPIPPVEHDGRVMPPGRMPLI